MSHKTEISKKPPNIARAYEPLASSTNATPLLDSKDGSNGWVASSSTTTPATSSYSVLARTGGSSNSIALQERTYDVPERLPSYSKNGPGGSARASRRLSSAPSNALTIDGFGRNEKFQTEEVRRHEKPAVLPAIPDELMAALALPPGSIFNTGAVPRGQASTSDVSKSSNNPLHNQAMLNQARPNPPHTTTHMTPADPSPRNTIFAASPHLSTSSGTATTSQRRSLRKAASAESLRATASINSGANGEPKLGDVLKSMRGLDIIGTTSVVTANFLPSSDDTATTSTGSAASPRKAMPNPRQANTGQYSTRADVKSIWKSFSSKIHTPSFIALASTSNSSNTGNRNAQEFDSSPSVVRIKRNNIAHYTLAVHNKDGKATRKSFESTVRHSLSIYPRPRQEKDISPVWHQAVTGKCQAELGDNQEIDNLPGVLPTTSQVSLGQSEVESLEGEISWLSRERFTHDLSKPSKKNLKHCANSGLTPACGGSSRSTVDHAADNGEEDAEEELNADPPSDDEDEENDEARQLSLIVSTVPLDTTSLSSINAQGEQVIGYKAQEREGEVSHNQTSQHTAPHRKNSNSVEQPKSMAASLQRNRADSNVMLPPRISTESIPLRTTIVGGTACDIALATNLKPSPPGLTPDTASTVYVDAFSSPLLSGPTSPAQNGSSLTSFALTSPAAEAAFQNKDESGSHGISGPCSNIPRPPSPVYTVRPRSMSESFLSFNASTQVTTGGPEARTSQQNKGNMLNVYTAERRVLEEVQSAETNEKSRESIAHLSDLSRTVIHENGDHSGNTTASSSFDLPRSSPNSRKSNAKYTVAIVGPKQVGKSTIIAQNLKLSSDKCTVLYEDVDGNKVLSYSGSYSITGKVCTLNVLEVDMDILQNTSEGLSWPPCVPRPEGVMICYKYGDPKALEQLKALLHGFWTRGGMHLIALATQCPAVQGNVTPYKAEGDKAAEICNIHGAGLVHLDGGIEDPNRKVKNSLQWILRKIVESRGQSNQPASRVKKLVAPKRSVATLMVDKKAGHDLPTALAELNSKAGPVHNSDTGHSLNTVSSHSGSIGCTDEIPLEQTSLLSKVGHSQTDMYLGQGELIQKLLFAAVAGNDEDFIASFLIVYRRFETPYKLLNSWLERFHLSSQHHDDDSILSRYVQMKLCNLLTRWLKFYPNDFCSVKTANLLRVLVEGLCASTWLHHYAIEIEDLVANMNSLTDGDSAWTLPDQEEETALHSHLATNVLKAGQKASLPVSLHPASSLPSSTRSTDTLLDSETSAPSALETEMRLRENTNDAPAMRPVQKTTSKSSSKIKLSLGHAVSPETAQLHFDAKCEQNRRMEAMMEISNTFLDCSADTVALQITRHAWDIFAHMQPRDLLRYVITPRDPKHPDARPQRNADNPVSKAVAFSNYLSNWSASVLLVQSKPKTRVRVFEHLIRLALALRNLDNLDCLMAVLVGLNSTPVHRLHDLASSVPENIYKKFRSMNFLMASTRSFAAYRLALTTARPEVVPYLGVHLQDITRVHDSKSDMRDGFVNWSKMRQLGKYASAVAHCGRLTPHYPYPYEERLSRLAIDAPVFSLDSDDDTLYELSYSYKARQKRSGSTSQKAKLRTLLREAMSAPGLSQFSNSASVL